MTSSSLHKHQNHHGVHQDTARHLGNAAHHFNAAHEAHKNGDVHKESHYHRLGQAEIMNALDLQKQNSKDLVRDHNDANQTK